MMNSLMTLFVGLATLVWGSFASVLLPRDIHWQNTTTTDTTITAIVSYSTPSLSLTTASETTSSEPIVYTIASNYTEYGTGSPSSIPTTASETISAEPTYTTITANVSYSTLSTSLTTTSKTISAAPSVYTPSNYTIPGNGSVKPIHWHLHNIRAFADRETQTDHYDFQALIQPNNDTAVCHGDDDSFHGYLDGIVDTECKAPVGLPHKNVSIPITFHFAWRSKVHFNGTYKTPDLLIIKSNSPGSAHACPEEPHDACWAQGLYWIPEHDIKPTDTGYRYTGPDSVHLTGTYCRTGMEECVWSEYLYM